MSLTRGSSVVLAYFIGRASWSWLRGWEPASPTPAKTGLNGSARLREGTRVQRVGRLTIPLAEVVRIHQDLMKPHSVLEGQTPAGGRDSDSGQEQVARTPESRTHPPKGSGRMNPPREEAEPNESDQPLNREPGMEGSRLVLLVGMSGGSGVVYGVRLLEVLKRSKVESHLIISTAAKETLVIETDYKVGYVESLASHVYKFNDIAAAPASGTFFTRGMVLIPCSMKSLAGIACGYSDNLILRAAEVTLKERRPLVLVPRETPLTTIHIENMLRVSQAGAIVLPAMPGFYNRPRTLDDLVNQTVGKVLDVLNVKHDLYKPWTGPRKERRGAHS